MSNATSGSTSRFPHLIIRASAGSGKTYQLSSRFIALLAAGQSPDSILATTFTRKAAGEIFDRVLLRLAEAAADEKKRAELAASIGDETLTQARVRTLLVETLASLHRLRIGTLDSFFMKMAGSFALELGLPPGWRIGDEVEDRELREEAVEAILGTDRSEELLTLFHLLTKGEARRGIGELVLETVTSLYDLFRETESSAWRKLTSQEPLKKEELADLLEEMAAMDLSKNTRQLKARDSDLENALLEDWGTILSKGLGSKVLTKENTFYSKPIPPDLIALYEKLLGHVNAHFVSQVIRQTEATHDLLTGFHEQYWQLKQESGSLRFDEVTRALAAAAAAVASPEQVAFRLDGQIGHILLDEFQDTALPQWQVIRPLALQVMEQGKKESSFFCVGDVKQAIYGWRGGQAEMFDSLDQDLPGLNSQPLSKSYRSSPVVIDVVNQVFRQLPRHPKLDHYQGAVDQFCSGFPEHTTTKTELPGYVCLRTAPHPAEGEKPQDQLLKFTARQVAALVAKAPGKSIGILCRRNDVVARLIYELRELKVAASEEGGNPLTDSSAVELVISLLQIADHPGDTVARFHIASSPIAKEIGLRKHDDAKAAAKLSHELRTELLRDGYGAAIYRWARLLAPSCDSRDLSRLQQLVEMAYDYQPSSTLRADAFIRLVQEQRKSDPSSANVRVMTVHQAKGLEFDAVFLPELDSRLLNQPPAFVAGRDSPLSSVNRVIRYAGDEVQRLLPPEWHQLFGEDRDRRLREALCTLYVAMTRPIHALYMIIQPAGDRQEQNIPKTCAGMLRSTLAPALNPPPDTILFEQGDDDWVSKLEKPASKANPAKQSEPKSRTVILAVAARPTRGLVRASPSGLEGGARVNLGRLLGEKSTYGLSYGSLMHAWFEAIDWLDDVPSTDGDLRAIAAAVSARIGELPSRSLPLEDFRKALRGPHLAALLSRKHYELAAGGKEITLEAHRELPFAFRQDDELQSGSIDRLVLVRQSGRLISAEVIDYKTDTVTSPNQLPELTAFYRPQLEAYKRAAEKITGLPENRITAKLVFLSADEVVPI
ncbi:MAG: UvrD-helicase domain-containing protein [Pirellulaceae bacterium]